MTDRIMGLTVTLEPDIRDDDAKPIIDAIRLLRGVIAVEPHIADSKYHFSRTAAIWELRKQLWEVLKESP